MAIFVEMPDYARAASLLDEAFNARTRGQTDDSATHAYFALAGQAVNSVRTHLERYRAFGINVSAPTDLPAEANGDINEIRGLLEHLSTQAKALHDEQTKGSGDGGTRGLDAAALLEDAATVRMRIARHEQDRAQWQAIVSEARQHLFSSDMRIASISEIPAARPAPAATQPAVSTSTPAASSPKSAQKADASAQKSSKKSQQQKPSATNSNAATATVPPKNAQPPGESQTQAGGAKAGGAPVAVGSLTSKAKQRVSPSYPAIARAARVTGTVTVFLVVNEKGEVETVQRLDGPPQLQQAAADAARRWRFNPTLIDGQPVRVTGYLSFNFAF
jgi:TonB family protein